MRCPLAVDDLLYLRGYIKLTVCCKIARQEVDRRIQEKEHSKKTHQRALESMQASIKAEARDKEETLKIKNMASLNTRSTA